MIRIRRSDPPAFTPQTVTLVSRALLPVLGWRDVPVLHEVQQKLTVLERFVLEMALALGTVTAEDFAEVVSLPRQVLAAGASRLIAGRALRLVGDGYAVEPEIAARTLRDQGIRRPLPGTADFVLLPRTGDFLALPPAKKSWLRQLELARIAPAGNAPVPVELWNQRRFGYLAARVRAGTATLFDTNIVEVSIPDDDPPLVTKNGNDGAAGDARLCAVYHCRAEVTRDERGQHTVRAVLHGKPRRRKNMPGSDQTNKSVEVPVQLTGADNLISEWLALAAELEDPVTQRAAWSKIGPAPAAHDQQPFRGARRRGPMEWEFLLTGQAALAVAGEHRPLDQPVGLTIENDKAAVQLVGWFVPDGNEARVLFAMDRAISQLLKAADPAKDSAAVCDSAATELHIPADRLIPQAIRDRAWDLAYYRLAYALRESEDFPYD
jgi:hypothetical protein